MANGFPPTMLLTEAQNWLRDRLKKGERCPCCRQYAKMYTRKLTSSMASALILFYREYKRTGNAEWIHFQTYIASLNLKPELASALHGGMHAKLRFWGLLEPKVSTMASQDEVSRGLFRITQRGIDFVEDRIKVPKFAVLYGNTKYNEKGPEIDLRAALDSAFDYEELMSS